MPFSGDYDGFIVAILEDLWRTAELDGIAVLDLTETDVPVPYCIGSVGQATVAIGRSLLIAHPDAPAHTVAPDQRSILACSWVLPPARPGGLVMWRAPGIRPWTYADHSLAGAITMLLHTTIASGIGQIGIDRLTGLPNRRWFLDEADRHIERLDMDELVGTLCLIDIDDLRRLNLTLGRAYGDRVLVRVASWLRTMVRPGDVVARIGTDEFALWQTGMDHLTAAERADALCSQDLFSDLPAGHAITFSIGIASRKPGSAEDVRILLQRARVAACGVRSVGGGGWRVSQAEPEPGCSTPNE